MHFTRPAKAYTWFRIVIYSCFNPTAGNWIYKNASGGLALGQVEFFGVKGEKEKVAPKVVKAEEPATPPVLDAPFIISYWCGPSQEQTTLASRRASRRSSLTGMSGKTVTGP